MDIRAAVAFEVNGPFRIETIQLRAPGPGEILVKMAATGLCHTDLTVLEGHLPQPFPIVLGHEGSATVVECGPGVTDLAPGDHVIPYSMPECGRCRGCRTRHNNYCDDLYPDLRSTDTPFSLNGKPLARFASLGTFAEYSVIKSTHLAKVRKDAPLDLLCLVGCGVATGIGSVLNTARVTPGSTVVIIGLGGIGLNVVQGARLADAGRIIAVDVNPDKESAARRFGATEFVNPKPLGEALAQHLLALTAGGGDFVFECAGTSALQSLAFAVTHPGWGVCTMVGAPPADQLFSTSPLSLIAGKTITGSSLGGVKGRSELPQLVDWYVEGKIRLDDLVSHRLTLEQINDGYDLMRRGQSVRAIITF